MTNRVSSFPGGSQPTPMHRYGGKLASTSELAISAVGDTYLIEGNGTVTSLPPWGRGPSVFLHMVAAPTFVNSSKLLMPAGQNYTFAAGDSALLLSLGDGVWRCVQIMPALASPAVTQILPQGRLTLTSGTPTPTVDVTAATTVFYTPATGKYCPIWNGSYFAPVDTGGELSQATTDATKSPAAMASASCYDMFVWNDAGTVRCTRGPVWSSLTARGTGAGTTELQFVNGVATNKYAVTNGPAAGFGTYVGTIRSGGTATVDLKFGTAAAGGGAATIGVWNAYNPAPVIAIVKDTTSTWSYQNATVRLANNSANNSVTFVKGLATDPIDMSYQCRVNFTTGAGSTAQIGFGMDAAALDFAAVYVSQSSGVSQTLVALGAYKPVLGGHYIAAAENTDATNNNQFVSLGVYQALKYSSWF